MSTENCILFVDSQFLDNLKKDSNGAFLIETVDQMAALAENVNVGLKFRLVNDIDFSGKEYTPIGKYNNEFSGTFDGGNHTISNITCKSAEEYVGLFGFTKGAIIKNLNLENCEFTNTLNNRNVSIYQ